MLLSTYNTLTILLVHEFLDLNTTEGLNVPRQHAVCCRYNIQLSRWDLLDSNNKYPQPLTPEATMSLLNFSYAVRVFEWVCLQSSQDPNKCYEKTNNSFNSLMDIQDMPRATTTKKTHHTTQRLSTPK